VGLANQDEESRLTAHAYLLAEFVVIHHARSLKHEYELYIEREIEDYKESVSRSELLSIGDAAVAALQAQQQLPLTELLLCAEVDRIIRKQLRLPSYKTWRKRCLEALQDFRRPERWGLHPDGLLALAVSAASNAHVFVAGASEEGPALYLAAHGCAVTLFDPTEEILERVVHTAAQVGLGRQVRGLVTDLRDGWAPASPFSAVVCARAAFAGLSPDERAGVIALLQNSTAAGGLHLVETIAGGKRLLPLDELAARYQGWQISVEYPRQSGETFLARKAVA
jgi:hypothetical protein